MEYFVKFSIITVCFNSRDTILSTLESVHKQTYISIEHIVIDGGSTDGTIDIVLNFQKTNSNIKFLSEPDQGIYFAMNKGLALATGQVIGFLNSDDIFYNDYIISEYAKIFATKDVDIVFGDLVYVDPLNSNKVIRTWKSGVLSRFRMLWGWHPAHPTFYARKLCYEKFGFFDTEFRIASDYEIMLRFIQKFNIHCYYLPICAVRMNIGGISNRSITNIIKANRECLRAWKKNGIPTHPFLIPFKLGRKILQHL